MRASTSRASESSDPVGFIVALLVRFPEIATLVSHPAEGTLTLSFAVAKRLDRTTQGEVRDLLLEHVRSLTALMADPPERLEVACETDEAMTFVRLTRDVRTITREELQMLTTLVSQRFDGMLLKSPLAEDEAIDDDPAAQDDAVEFALDALRDPSQQKSLVGYREEKRVMVYFVSARKKAKARGR
jgi:hypothetical protein